MSTSEELKKQLEELQTLIASTQEALAPIEKEKAEANAEEAAAYAAYKDAVAKARVKKEAADKKAFEFQSALNNAKWKATELERTIKQQEAEALKEAERAAREAELQALNERWDTLTRGASWREWAKQHQIDAGHTITENRNVILADPMGLGKTLSAIITADMAEAATRQASSEHPFLGEEKEVYVPNKWMHNETGEVVDFNPWSDDYTLIPSHYTNKIVNAVERPVGKRILYFCPSSMIRNVEREFRMWAKHRNVTFVGGMTKAERGFVFDIVLKDRADFVVICNYEAWRKDLSLIDSFIGLDPDTVIIDEAHNVKNMKSSAYRGLKRLIDEAKPEYVIPMTGTPILNRPQELFSLLTLVNPSEFYREKDFLYNFCEQDDAGFWKFQSGGLDRIAKKIRKNFLRRTKDQAGIELPEKTITLHELTVDTEAWPNQAKAREQMRKYATIMVDEAKGQAITAAAMIAVFTRLRQIETWPAGIVVRDEKTKNIKFAVDVEESQKMDYVISEDRENREWNGLIPEIIEDERIVLFSQFKAPLREIAARVERMGKRAVVLDGDTPDAIRQEIQIDFDNRHTPDRANAKWDIVLCNYRVGGVGMNLTAATQMIILDEEWNPGKRDQAYDRIHRIGQDKPVTIHVIRNLKTIDDWLSGIMEAKEGIVEGFNNKMVDADEFKDWLDNGGLL